MFTAVQIAILLTSITIANAIETEVLETTAATKEEWRVEGLSSGNLSEKFFNKAYTYIRNSPAFQHYSTEELINMMNELDVWEAPERLSKSFPYYLAGYDSEDRPVWVSEAGKYDIRSEVERGPENTELLIKYMFQSMLRVIKTIYDKDTPEREVRHAVFISDLDGFDVRQYAHAETIGFCLRLARDYKEVTEEIMGGLIFINVNHLARTVLQLFRPILGRVLERVEVYGTNTAKWKPQIRRLLPENNIPSWYGGSENFKAIQIYG